MSFPSFLTEVITVERPDTPARDSSGGLLLAWTTRQAGVPAQVNSPSAQQRLQYQMLQLAIPYTFFTEYASAQNGDRILLDDGTYVRITGINSVLAAGTLGTYYEINGEAVQP